ncbi:MAG: hypothetical protein HYR66_13125 [Sphingobacteriales bacterium]|nr:hypothetical protein [Sphingobacteriales bacterium]MBI3719983.1 hypothetical protein [Sphingobacteriales bacterium]
MKPVAQSSKQSTRAEWFDNLIATLKTHELQLETNTASEEMRQVYDIFMGDDLDAMFKMNKDTTQKYFVRKIIVEYLKSLDKNLPQKLAFDFNDSEVLVWAEINDNDEVQEKILARAESRINSIFHPYGFDMESMIVEKGDNLPIPNHYKTFKA